MRLIDAEKIDFSEVFGGQSDFAKDVREEAKALIDKQPTAFEKKMIFENSPFDLIDKAFKNLYPGKEYRACIEPDITDDQGEKAYGITIFYKDDIPIVAISVELTIKDAAEVFAHELAHFQGIARESEANLYSFLVCIRSDAPSIRLSGYLSILPHVLSNASRLMEKEEYATLYKQIRPEVIMLAQHNQQYWAEKYNPLIGRIQDILYDLYLKGNKISSGRKNYSEVIGLLISYQEWEKQKPTS